MVSAAFLMWIPVCGPWQEFRLSLPGQMVYLFLMSIFPTLPAAWLANSDSVVYTVYDHGPGCGASACSTTRCSPAW